MMKQRLVLETARSEAFNPFESYKERVINNLCESFLPIYKEISEPLWNNGIYAYVRRAYFYYDHESGDFEFWIPTAPNEENYMCSFRVAGRVVPKLSQKRLEDEAKRLGTRFVSPMSIQDGEQIFVIAPKAVYPLPRGFCHNHKKGYRTYAIVTDNPEKAVERILKLVWNYVYKRLRGLCDKLNIKAWIIDKLLRGTFKVGKSLLLWLSEKRFSQTIINIFENFIALCRWLWERVKHMRILQKIQNSILSLHEKLLWLKTHIKEGKLLKEINHFLKSLKNKLPPYTKKKKECSYINKYNNNYKRASFILFNRYLEHKFRDDPEELKKREKALLELLKT